MKKQISKSPIEVVGQSPIEVVGQSPHPTGALPLDPPVMAKQGDGRRSCRLVGCILSLNGKVYEELVSKQNFVEAGRCRKKLRLENESHQECQAERSVRSRSLPVRTVEHVDAVKKKGVESS